MGKRGRVIVVLNRVDRRVVWNKRRVEREDTGTFKFVLETVNVLARPQRNLLLGNQFARFRCAHRQTQFASYGFG